eukprot:SAG11_NODE_341_length_10462_cov_49.272990_5_plen_71_part_00
MWAIPYVHSDKMRTYKNFEKKFPKILRAAGWGAPHCESTEKVRPRPVATAARQCAQKRFLPNFFSDTIVL